MSTVKQSEKVATTPVEEKEKSSLEGRPGTGSVVGSERSLGYGGLSGGRKPLPIAWRGVMIILTCLCAFGNHWSNALIVALKTTIISNLKINNSEFATLVAVTNLMNTFLCIALGYCIDKYGGASLSVVLAAFHLAGSIVMAGAATNGLNSYPLLIVGKVLAAVGDGSLDNAQHRIFSTYFAPGKGFAFSIGAIWSVANLAQFAGQSTANIISTSLGTYAWTLWISSIIALFSLLCAVSLVLLDRYLRDKYEVTDHTSGKRHVKSTNENISMKAGVFKLKAIRSLPMSFWLVVAFAVFENAGVQSFVSISTQFAQQRLKKGAVIGGWVSSFYLLLPAGLTPFLGIFIDMYGHRVSFLLASGVTFLISMLLLKFSHTVPTFVAAYVFYALSQAVTPAPQVEIVRSIIPDPAYFATGFAIKKSVVQASIVIITTAAGRLQDLSPTNSLDPAVSLWLAYAFVSVFFSGLMVFLSHFTNLLPASTLSQITPAYKKAEVDRMWSKGMANASSLRGEVIGEDGDGDELSWEEKEKVLKAPKRASKMLVSVVAPAVGMGIILLGWVMFGLGVSWGVHGSVIAGTVGE
ncbi:MFS general substrate transporter [Stereum hirsutum FP-91666 SS1]|uniref:MFS general substrate transporter n=1 Tax=Stereum hirsutum (strain FP-91666) TaxID=721885 RepID=UPI0004449B36|nr:MFS general substrate transporter [Stereum hirsutum FP-91666 SS1]EIM85473.1 MFS general substrate transporter [Stereum hirsutum FP-91666 SS1]